MHSSGIIPLSSLSLVTDVIDVTLGASDLGPGTRAGVVGTTTLALNFFDRNSWLHGQQQGWFWKTVIRISNF